MKKILFIAFLLMIVSFVAQAQVPRTLNLQSIVYDVDGSITTSESVDLTVRILDGSGNVLYTEDIVDIAVVNGAINVEIGDATGGIPLSALDPSTGERLLDVTVDGESPFDLLPLSAVPYAIYAERALTVPEDSIESKHIKDGTIQLEDLHSSLQFSDIEGQIGEGQAPGTFTMDSELETHKDSDDHTADEIKIGVGLFSNFAAGNVLVALKRLDALVSEATDARGDLQTAGTNLQSDVSSNDTDISNLQTTTSDINNIPGTLGEGKIDGAIARDSELTFGNISGTISDGQIPASITRDSELSFGNISGTISDGQIPSSITRDSELSFGNISGQISDSQIPASIARDSEIPSVITDHGALGGLGDNDHPHYLQRSGSQAMTGSLNMGGNNITSVGTVDGVDVSALNTQVNTNTGDISGHETRITALEGGPPCNPFQAFGRSNREGGCVAVGACCNASISGKGTTTIAGITMAVFTVTMSNPAASSNYPVLVTPVQEGTLVNRVMRTAVEIVNSSTFRIIYYNPSVPLTPPDVGFSFLVPSDGS